MGGAKKQSLSQAEKQQELRDQKQKGKAARKTQTKTFEKRIGGIDVSNVSSERLISEFKEAKAITPYTLASKYSLRMSVAKRVLGELVEQGILQPITGSSRLRVYKVAKG